MIVNRDKTVIGGHQRISVLKELGYIEIDCVIIDVDKTKEKALNIALNKLSGELYTFNNEPPVSRGFIIVGRFYTTNLGEALL